MRYRHPVKQREINQERTETTMGLFQWRPQPPREQPSEAPRFAERLERDLKKYLLASIFAFAGLLPFILGVGFSISSHAVLPLLLAGGLGGMLAAPGLCGLTDTLLRSLRDEAGMWWHTYRRVWKRNFRASLLPGVFFGLLFSMQLFAVTHLDLLDAPMLQLGMLGLSALLLFGILAYLLPMLVLLELPFGAMLKNSLLLFLRHFPKSLLAAIILFVFSCGILLWFPVSTIVLLVGGLWIPFFLACRIIYPILDQYFCLTAAIASLNRTRKQP